MTNNKFSRTASNINHQTIMVGRRQTVGDPDIDETRFFPAGNDFDRVAQHSFRFVNKNFRITGNSQRIGADYPHRIFGHATQTFGK